MDSKLANHELTPQLLCSNSRDHIHSDTQERLQCTAEVTIEVRTRSKGEKEREQLETKGQKRIKDKKGRI
jgi:hypothetical protein